MHIRPVPYLTIKQQDLFWKKVYVREKDDCWEWIGYRHEKGYGRTSINGQVYSAHRIACRIGNGESPAQKPIVCHACDNPPCCNPRHLFWGSSSDNIIDAVSKGPWAAGINPDRQKGERNPNAKFSTETIQAIKTASGRQWQIALQFGTSQAHVSRIKLGQRRGEG